MVEEERESPGEGENPPSGEPATFEGRLRLKDFVFTPREPAAPRHSPRLPPRAPPAPRSGAGTTTTSVSASPSKRGPGSPSPGSPDSSPSASANKRPRRQASYAPPSTYAHLPLLPDAVGPDMLVLFVGLNPGIQTARTGHAYAHPSNLFWKLLYSSGVTPRPCAASEDREMPALFRLGLTNIVERPSRSGAELSRAEMDAGVAALEDKARRWRPESVCLVGKGIWESVWRVRHGGRGPSRHEFRYGWQDPSENMGVVRGGSDSWPGARVFVATSTSGLAASLSPGEKREIWNQLGEWVKRRRAETEADTS